MTKKYNKFLTQKNMKILKSLLLTLPFLFLSTVTHAIMIAPNSDLACIQKIQPAVSPDGECKEFPTSCEVPSDWKAIPRCDLVEEHKDKTSISLEEKMRKNLGKARRKFRGTKRIKRKTSRYSQKATSGLRKLRAYTNPSQKKNSKKLKTSTRKNYSALGAQRRTQRRNKYIQSKKHDVVNKLTKDKTQKKYSRPKFRSRIKKNISGKLSSTPKWKVAQKAHFKKKKFGINPYNLHSRYNKNQKRARAKKNKSINVKKRLHSGFKTFRGKRKLGSLEGEIQE